MKIKVTFTHSEETKTVILNDKKSNGLELLKKIDIKPDTAVLLVKNKPVPVDSELKDGQHLTLMNVSSSG